MRILLTRHLDSSKTFKTHRKKGKSYFISILKRHLCLLHCVDQQDLPLRYKMPFPSHAASPLGWMWLARRPATRALDCMLLVLWVFFHRRASHWPGMKEKKCYRWNHITLRGILLKNRFWWDQQERRPVFEGRCKRSIQKEWGAGLHMEFGTRPFHWPTPHRTVAGWMLPSPEQGRLLPPQWVSWSGWMPTQSPYRGHRMISSDSIKTNGNTQKSCCL